MNEDELIRVLRKRFGSAVAAASDVSRAEDALGFKLPRFYKRLLTEVANGGFGPGQGIVGLPPDGHLDDDIGELVVRDYLDGRAGSDPKLRTPEGILVLCSWGCGIISHVDAFSPDEMVVTSELLGDEVRYVRTAESLRKWLESWNAGADLQATMFEVVAYREGINPFTKKPHTFAETRPRGPEIDFAARQL